MSHLYFLVFTVKVYIDDFYSGEIDDGQIKRFEINHSHPVIRFEGLVNDLILNLDLNHENFIEIYQSIDFGMIRCRDHDHIVISKKMKIKWKNYFILLTIYVIVLAIAVFVMLNINFNLL